MSDRLKQLEAKYPKAKYNWLMPSVVTGTIGYAHELQEEIVWIDPDARNGEVFPVSGTQDKKTGKYSAGTMLNIARPGLDSLKSAAGISIKTEESHLTAKIAVVEAHGLMRKADGSYVMETRRKKVDLDAKREKLQLQWEKKLERERKFRAEKKWKPIENEKAWIASNVRKELVEVREYMLERSETGASNRVIRALLGIKTMTVERMGLPFVVFKIAFAPQLSDPTARLFALQQGQVAMAALWGARAALPAIESQRVTVEPVDVEHEEIEEPEEEETVPEKQEEKEEAAPTEEELEGSVAPEEEAAPEEEKEEDGGGEMSDEENAKLDRVIAWEEKSPAFRVRTILTLAEEKGVNLSVKVKDMSPSEQAQMVVDLEDAPPKEEATA